MCVPQYLRMTALLTMCLWLFGPRQSVLASPRIQVTTTTRATCKMDVLLGGYRSSSNSKECQHKKSVPNQKKKRVKRRGSQALYHNYNLDPKDHSYTFSYDTGWTPQGRSFRYETRDALGNVEGEFGYVGPDGVARVTKYTADTRGYRTRSFIVPKQEEEEEQELLIVGPIPPHLKKKHLENNPDAVIKDGPSYQDVDNNVDNVNYIN